jgi:hypothetical protein
MSQREFQHEELENDWRCLIDAGPRFPGTRNEIIAQDYIKSRLSGVADVIADHEFRYLGWSLAKQPRLSVVFPSPYEIPCYAFIYSPPTPKMGLRGKVVFVGNHRIISAYGWVKLAIVDEEGRTVGYISGRPDGPAQPQPLDRGSSPLPHFAIGEHDLELFLSWLKRGIDVVVKADLESELNPTAKSKNIIASFNNQSEAPRIALCAHYDSMYGCPGANDNAGGVAALLSIGRKIARDKLDWPVDLLFFSAEEWELAGSRAYVADYYSREKKPNTKVLINLDGISEGDQLAIWSGPEGLETDIRMIAASFEHPRKVEKLYCFPPPAGADHIPFYYQEGIPVCMLSFQDMVKYHLPVDTFCAEGVDNIEYATEFTWWMIKAFVKKDLLWPTTQGIMSPENPGSWLYQK